MYKSDSPFNRIKWTPFTWRIFRPGANAYFSERNGYRVPLVSIHRFQIWWSPRRRLPGTNNIQDDTLE